jgi:hypothetical protein
MGKPIAFRKGTYALRASLERDGRVTVAVDSGDAGMAIHLSSDEAFELAVALTTFAAAQKASAL